MPRAGRRARQRRGAAVIQLAGVERQTAGVVAAIPAGERQRAGTVFHQRQQTGARPVGGKVAVADAAAVRAVRGIIDRERAIAVDAAFLLGVFDDAAAQIVAQPGQRLVVPQQLEIRVAAAGLIEIQHRRGGDLVVAFEDHVGVPGWVAQVAATDRQVAGNGGRAAALLQIDHAAVDRGVAAVIVAGRARKGDRAGQVGQGRRVVLDDQAARAADLPAEREHAVVDAVAHVAGGRQGDVAAERIKPAAAVAVKRRPHHAVGAAADAVERKRGGERGRARGVHGVAGAAADVHRAAA